MKRVLFDVCKFIAQELIPGLLCVILLVKTLPPVAIAQEEEILLPIGQVQISEIVDLYPAPNPDAVSEKRARPGDVLLIYAQIENWVRAENGWFQLTEQMSLEPAVVHYGAILPEAVEVARYFMEPPTATLPANSNAGIAAISGEWAFLYSSQGVGWTPLSKIQVVEPLPDLLDFVEQRAYIQTEFTYFYDQPAGVINFSRPLGEAVDLLYVEGEWVLVRGKNYLGWSELAHFDRVLMPLARGMTSAGPVNVRITPVDGRVITALDYHEDLLVLGRNATSDWLHIRARGLDGWISADFVDFEGTIAALPVIE